MTPAAVLYTFAIEAAQLAGWLALLCAIFVPLEHWFGERRPRLRRTQTGIDLAYYFINSMVPTLILSVVMAAIAVATRRVLHGVPHYFAGLPFWWNAAATLVVSEFGFYWGHRWLHEIPFLWRFHAVHHSPERVDWLVNTRAHPVDMVFNRLCGMVPLYALGLTQAGPDEGGIAAVAVLIGGALWGFFIHADLRWRFGWLEWAISTPAFHRWHHSNDAWRDHNYASMLPWIDRIFGTFHLPPRAMPESYGIDTKIPTTISGQTIAPFRRSWPREPVRPGVMIPGPVP